MCQPSDDALLNDYGTAVQIPPKSAPCPGAMMTGDGVSFSLKSWSGTDVADGVVFGPRFTCRLGKNATR